MKDLHEAWQCALNHWKDAVLRSDLAGVLCDDLEEGPVVTMHNQDRKTFYRVWDWKSNRHADTTISDREKASGDCLFDAEVSAVQRAWQALQNEVNHD